MGKIKILIKNEKHQKNETGISILIRITIFFILFSTIPAVLSIIYQFTQNLYIEKLLLGHQGIYIWVFMFSLISRGLLALFFPDNHQEIEDLPDIDSYGTLDPKMEIPEVVWMSILGAIILVLILALVWVAVN